MANFFIPSNGHCWSAERGGGGRIYQVHRLLGNWESFSILPGYLPDEIVRLSRSPVQVQLRTYNNFAVYADDNRGELHSESLSNPDLPKYKFTMSAQTVHFGGSGIHSCSEVAFRAFNGYYVAAETGGGAGEVTLFLARTTVGEAELFQYQNPNLQIRASLNSSVDWEEQKEYTVSCQDELGASVPAKVIVNNPGEPQGTFTANIPFTWVFMYRYISKTGVYTYPTIKVEPFCYRNSVSWTVRR